MGPGTWGVGRSRSSEQINPRSGHLVDTHYALVIITIRARASLGARPHKGAHGQYGQGMTTESDSFPKRHARTQRFTLGAPRSFTVAPDGSRVAFLRSGTGTDRANSLDRKSVV